jgi:antitoxin YefM
MKTVNFPEASSSLGELLDRVVADADVTVISRRDAPDAVVMSLDYYSSLMETVYLLSSPANAAHLGESIQQARAGRSHQRDLVETPDVDDHSNTGR